MAENRPGVIIGADTHKRAHTVAVVSGTGEELAAKEFAADAAGYRQALAWARSFGRPLRAGVESTGAYGAGLCACLKGAGIEVYDVWAPDRGRRRLQGKDDAKDAFQAAQAALSHTRCSVAKDKGTDVDSALAVEGAYRLAVRQRTASMNALKAAVLRLPAPWRARLEGKGARGLVPACAALRAAPDAAGLGAGARAALRHYARQVQSLDKDISLLDKEVRRYAALLVPNTLGPAGVGCHGAVTLLGAAGANIGRMRGEAAFSMLCGTSPVPASSGDRCHYRLNRGGDRKANCALHVMAITRMRVCAETRSYIARKMSEGKSKKDAVRALKRYLSREVFCSLKADLAMLGLVP